MEQPRAGGACGGAHRSSKSTVRSCDGHAGHAMAKFVSARDGQELVVHFRPVQQLLCANAAGCGDERLHVTSGILALTGIVMRPSSLSPGCSNIYMLCGTLL